MILVDTVVKNEVGLDPDSFTSQDNNISTPKKRDERKCQGTLC